MDRREGPAGGLDQDLRDPVCGVEVSTGRDPIGETVAVGEDHVAIVKIECAFVEADSLGAWCEDRLTSIRTLTDSHGNVVARVVSNTSDWMNDYFTTETITELQGDPDFDPDSIVQWGLNVTPNNVWSNSYLAPWGGDTCANDDDATSAYVRGGRPPIRLVRVGHARVVHTSHRLQVGVDGVPADIAEDAAAYLAHAPRARLERPRRIGEQRPAQCDELGVS